MDEIKFLKKTVSPYSSTTLKIVDVSPMMPDSDNTKTSTPLNDSLGWYETVESEKVAGSNAPTFKDKTAFLEGSKSKAGVSKRVTEHTQFSSTVIVHTPFPHVLFSEGYISANVIGSFSQGTEKKLAELTGSTNGTLSCLVKEQKKGVACK
jgi:hypothetical protein